MKKLTKDQKHYRKKKQDGEKDFRQTNKEDGTRGVRVTRKTINVSISQAAFDRLLELSESEQLSRWKMLTRIIITQIPMYAKLTASSSPTKRYDWDESLLSPTDKKISYKGTEGERQVTYQITSTAFKKLESHKNAIAQSKARIIQSLILNYKPTSQEQRDKQNAYINASRKNHKQITKGIALDESLSPVKRRKFFKQDGLILHVKGLPPEKWDDDELDEFESMHDELNN